MTKSQLWHFRTTTRGNERLFSPPREVTGGSASVYTNDECSLFVGFGKVRCSVPLGEDTYHIG